MTDTASKAIANKIREIRREQGLKQIDIANSTGLNINYYARVEQGKIKPSADKYKMIATALNTTISEITKGI